MVASNSRLLIMAYVKVLCVAAVLSGLLVVSPALAGGVNNIFAAVKSKDLAGVREIVKKNPGLVKARDDQGKTPLHLATFECLPGIVKYLVGKGSDIRARDKDKWTPLLFDGCCWRAGGIAIVKLLLTKGADINAQSRHGRTPLHNAIGNAETRDVGMVKLLLGRGADVNAVDEDGWTPLHTAVYFQRVDIVELLLTYRAKVNIKNKKGRTALDMAVKREFNYIAKLLRRHGARD